MAYLNYFNTPDALSMWFIAIITIVFIAGAFYGADYLKAYKDHKREIALHVVSYIVTYVAMIALTIVNHAVVFLVAWEIMALGSFFLIIFESWKKDVLKAGLNFFIQSHVSVVFLTFGFMMMYAKTGSFYFSDFAAYREPCGWPFALICAGFALKAGFVPFHTWLPIAHPVAPAHISGVMSGVIIKIGIYGLLRAVTIFNVDLLVTGKVILIVAAISGLYGVMMAIVQHNLKKLLAYHSIENIGIIGIGIGIGCISSRMGMGQLASLSFAGALLHTFNHALFKSSLFFTAGNVYQATHTLNVEKMGGLMKKMPLTAMFFLISAVAICGLPPMNGFVSELMIYMGLYGTLIKAPMLLQIGTAAVILALALIGGLAILCFTKAFGIVFLGESRSELPQIKEFGAMRTIPLAVMALIMLSVGVFPSFYIGIINNIIPIFGTSQISLSGAVPAIGRASAILIAVALVLWLLRSFSNKNKTIKSGDTWGCAYPVPSAKMQYTATSFVNTYTSLVKGVLKTGLIDKCVNAYLKFTGRFAFLQNGHVQSYILYGIVFIVVTIILTLVLC